MMILINMIEQRVDRPAMGGKSRLVGERDREAGSMDRPLGCFRR